MAFTTPIAGAGLARTAANWVTYVTNNLTYLKGQAGTVTYEAALLFENDANFGVSIVASNPRITFDSNDYIDYVRASNQFRVTINSVVEMLLVGAGITYSNSFYSLEATAAKMHLESAISPMEIILGAAGGATGDDAFTFTKPYNDLPVVVHGLFHTSTTKADYVGLDAFIKRNTLATTGVTLTKFAIGSNVVMISHMMALGVHD